MQENKVNKDKPKKNEDNYYELMIIFFLETIIFFQTF